MTKKEGVFTNLLNAGGIFNYFDAYLCVTKSVFSRLKVLSTKFKGKEFCALTDEMR